MFAGKSCIGLSLRRTACYGHSVEVLKNFHNFPPRHRRALFLRGKFMKTRRGALSALCIAGVCSSQPVAATTRQVGIVRRHRRSRRHHRSRRNHRSSRNRSSRWHHCSWRYRCGGDSILARHDQVRAAVRRQRSPHLLASASTARPTRAPRACATHMRRSSSAPASRSSTTAPTSSRPKSTCVSMVATRPT